MSRLVATASRWSLKGKNVVVTGGTKGIGRACVEELCALGATVLTCARNSAEVQACEQEWKDAGFSVHAVVADLSTDEGRGVVMAAIAANFDGSVHCLVNNVGTNVRKRAIEYSDEEYEKIMSTNLKSAFNLTTQLYPNLRSAGGASVVNIGSVAGGCNTAMRSGVIYAMTKAAIAQMGSNLACEWAKDGIRVNTIAPWYIDTPLVQPVLQDPELLRTVLQRTPMGRVGQPQEVSALAAFLCMDSAAYISGQVIAVDGAFLRNGFY